MVTDVCVNINFLSLLTKEAQFVVVFLFLIQAQDEQGAMPIYLCGFWPKKNPCGLKVQTQSYIVDQNKNSYIEMYILQDGQKNKSRVSPTINI